ncbi:MAG: hypothetical protein RLZZ387_5310 [Chloroflexota bacterium]|jgi:hypothetical protein
MHLSHRSLTALYTLATFASATLLFVVQPLYARMVLPLLGGSPAVWNTSMLFFQAALLAGYGYAHLSTRLLGARRQAALHVALLLPPLLVLPIAVPAGWTPPATENPAPWLLALLAVAVGPPFLVLSASSPLLQKWFAATGHPHAADPYFLYAASNLGSMLALLSYPLLIEPTLRLADQSRLWSAGYVALAALMALCALALWRAPPGRETATDHGPQTAGHGPQTADRGRPANDQRPTTNDRRPQTTASGRGAQSAPSSLVLRPSSLSPRRIARWVFLAFVPSSLMVSVTTYISTEIAAIPLLWVLPLALYLLTFILVFASRPPVPHALVARLLPLAVLPLVFLLVSGARQPIGLIVAVHLLAFFVVALACHGELARDRPPVESLTAFYMWMSFGGVLGGLFNAIVAPLAFDSIAEYPLVLTLACAALPGALRWEGRPAARLLDLVAPLALAMAGMLALRLLPLAGAPDWAATLVGVALPTALCLMFLGRPLRFAAGVGALLLAGVLFGGQLGSAVYTERSFFGVHRVVRFSLAASGDYHGLIHGTTLHGTQSLDPARRDEPLNYYHSRGPAGRMFAALGEARVAQPVALVGLGAGALTCYASPGQPWELYEIDPEVERIARDERLFTYLRDCAPDAPVILGDARIALQRAPDGRYGLMLLDAYSSDAPPLHLLTREAFQVYLQKLAPGGVLALHITNRHMDLEPVIGALARDAGLTALVGYDRDISAADAEQAKTPSRWVVMARDPADLASLASDPFWRPADIRPGTPLWTDDFSSLLAVLRGW